MSWPSCWCVPRSPPPTPRATWGSCRPCSSSCVLILRPYTPRGYWPSVRPDVTHHSPPNADRPSPSRGVVEEIHVHHVHEAHDVHGSRHEPPCRTPPIHRQSSI